MLASCCTSRFRFFRIPLLHQLVPPWDWGPFPFAWVRPPDTHSITLQSFDNLACETFNGHAPMWPWFNSQRSDPWLQYMRRAFYLVSELHPLVRVLNHCTRFTSPLQSWNFKEPAPCWWHLLYWIHSSRWIIIIIITRNMIFAGTCKARVKVTTILFSLVLKQEKHAFSKCYTILHTHLWIESILGHSFLACNLLWSCSLTETSDS